MDTTGIDITGIDAAGRPLAAHCAGIGAAALTPAVTPAGTAAEAGGGNGCCCCCCCCICAGCGCSCGCCCICNGCKGCAGAGPELGSGGGSATGADTAGRAGAADEVTAATGALVGTLGAAMPALLPCCPNMGPEDIPATDDKILLLQCLTILTFDCVISSQTCHCQCMEKDPGCIWQS